MTNIEPSCQKASIPTYFTLLLK